MKREHLSNLQFLKQHFHSTLPCSTSSLLLMLITCLFFYPSNVQVLVLLVSMTFVSSDICDEDREKRDYVRSISKNTRRDLDWFRPSRRVISLRPVLMYYAA
jgi:hypothetical protein